MDKVTKLIVSLTFIVALVCGGVIGAEAAGKPMVFKWAVYYPETHLRTKVWKEYSAKVREVTGGLVDFKIYSGQSLLKAKQEFEAVLSNVIDITSGPCTPYITGYQSWALFADVPGLAENFGQFMEILRKARPIIQKHYDKFDLKILWLHPTTLMNFFSKDGFIKTMDDFKGLKGRMAGGFTSEAYKRWGGAPVTMSVAEAYTALQRGTVDCIYTGTDSYVSFKLYEVAPYVTKFEHAIYAHLITMNKKSWDKIPADYQKKILDVGEEFMGNITKIVMDQQEDIYDKMVANGAKLYDPTPELRKAMRKEVEPLWERYRNETGDTGRELYDTVLKPYLND